MAIYHLHMQTISRADGRSAVAAAAYRAASRLTAADGRVFDFRRKQGVVAREIFVPEGCPPISRQDLWLLAENTEKRKNSTLAREMDMAIPVELNKEERFKLTAKFCRWLAQEYQVAVDCCMHRKDKNDPQENPHLHVMFTTRRYSQEGTLGAKTRELDDLKTRTTHLLHVREKWADFCNEYLQFYGETIDHRSFKDQGIDLLPQIHVGSAATTMIRRGLETERGLLNQAIQGNNSSIMQLQQEIENVRCLGNESDRNCSAGIDESAPTHSSLFEKSGEGGSKQRLGAGFGIDGYGSQRIAGSQSSTTKHGQGSSATIAFGAKSGGTSGSTGARPCAVEDGRPASAALTTKTERLAALEVMTQSCVRASGEIQTNIHALVEAANLRCLENSIRQHQLQLLKERSTGVLVECGSVIREILHAVDRVNVQAIYQAHLISTTHSSSRLNALAEKSRSIISVSHNIQQEILAAVDRRNVQYIQDYLEKTRLKQLKASCLNVCVECGSVVREIFEATDRLDALFMEQWLARHSATKIMHEQGAPLILPLHRPGIIRMSLKNPEPLQRAKANSAVRITLGAPEPSGSDYPEAASSTPDNAATDFEPT